MSRGIDFLILLPLGLALFFLVPRLDWGMASAPQGIAAVQSYEPDECHYMNALLRMSLHPLRIDPGHTHWGGLSYPLLGAAAFLAQGCGIIPGGFRRALYSGDSARIRRVYLALRGVSVIATLVLILATFCLARRRFGSLAGSFAAMLVATSPAVVLYGRSLVADMLAAALITLAFIPASAAAAGFLLGLSVGAKYSAAVFLPVMVFWHPRKERLGLAGAFVAGFAVGAPFTLVHFVPTVKDLVHTLIMVHRPMPEDLGPLRYLRHQAVIIAFFTVGLPGLAMAALALARGIRMRTSDGELAGAVLSCGWLWIILAHFPVIRYQLPMIPFYALLAAQTLCRARPTLRPALAALALAPPAILSMLFVFGVPRLHAYESAKALIVAMTRPGIRIAKPWPGKPVFPGWEVEYLQTFSLGEDPPPPTADFLLEEDDDGGTMSFASSYIGARNKAYVRLGVFGWAPRLGSLAWPRLLTAHDARYSNARVTVWKRRERPDGS